VNVSFSYLTLIATLRVAEKTHALWLFDVAVFKMVSRWNFAMNGLIR
jgi:hypothetical protein